jgi:hypothetical protein
VTVTGAALPMKVELCRRRLFSPCSIFSFEHGPQTASPRRPYVRFTRWRRAHFFRVLEETGHVQMAAAAAGVSLGCI